MNQNTEKVRVGRWLGLWTFERWNPRVLCWDVVYTFSTQRDAEEFFTVQTVGDHQGLDLTVIDVEVSDS